MIDAEGEFQAAQRLEDASHILSQEPAALQLRYLQTLTEIATEQNSTILFPFPMDLRRLLPPPGRRTGPGTGARWRAAHGRRTETPHNDFPGGCSSRSAA